MAGRRAIGMGLHGLADLLVERPEKWVVEQDAGEVRDQRMFSVMPTGEQIGRSRGKNEGRLRQAIVGSENRLAKPSRKHLDVRIREDAVAVLGLADIGDVVVEVGALEGILRR